MTLIRQPYELEIQPKIKALIYGQAGTGKTTLAVSSPRPLLIDCDGGIHRVNFVHHVPTVQVSCYQDVLMVLSEDLTAYDTIVIDTGGKLLDYMASDIISRDSRLGKSNGTLTLQGYGERKAEFSAFCRRISSLDKHLVFVAHRETLKEGDAVRYVPLFGGSNYDSLVTELDLVIYLEAIGKERVLTADPSSRNDGKNTCNLPLRMKLPIVVDSQGKGSSNTFFGKYIIDSYTARLEKAKENRDKYTSLIGEIEDDIILITDCDGANDFIQRINNYEHIGNSKAVAAEMLKRKAKELNLTLNKEKVYECAI